MLTKIVSKDEALALIRKSDKAPPNKDMGEGLNTAFQKMKDWKLKSENQMKNVFYALRDAGKIVMVPKGNKTECTLRACAISADLMPGIQSGEAGLSQ